MARKQTWAKYAQKMLFPSEEAAREWVFQKREYADILINWFNF
jgi:hypothetical protein